MSLINELQEIMRIAAAEKAEEERLIDATFPQPEPHRLVLDEASMPTKPTSVLIMPAAKAKDNGPTLGFLN